MEFPEGKYRLRNGAEVDIDYRHHGWGLSTTCVIPGLNTGGPTLHCWVIQERTAPYRGSYAQLKDLWDGQGRGIRDSGRSQYDILERIA